MIGKHERWVGEGIEMAWLRIGEVSASGAWGVVDWLMAFRGRVLLLLGKLSPVAGLGVLNNHFW